PRQGDRYYKDLVDANGNVRAEIFSNDQWAKVMFKTVPPAPDPSPFQGISGTLEDVNRLIENEIGINPVTIQPSENKMPPMPNTLDKATELGEANDQNKQLWQMLGGDTALPES